jgi:DNA-binding beta-propeller fold protein YncE
MNALFMTRAARAGRRAGMLLAAGLCCASLLAGCASAPATAVKEPVFFPPPPNAPRVQFLKAIAGSKDVVDATDSFSLFLRGQTKEDIEKFIIKPYGITYAKGKLYVCDAQGLKVAIIDLINKKFDFLKGTVGLGRLKKPINVAVDDDGSLFVVDTMRKEILSYDAAGNFIQAYGKGIVNKPVDVALDSEGLYILDLGDGDIKVLDRKSGGLIRKFGNTAVPEGEAPVFAMPTNMAFDSKGFIYATNISLANVVKLDKDGHLLFRFGKLGDAFGEFTRPKGIAVDETGRIFVVDGGAQNVQIFNETGRLLMFFGDPPLPEGALNLPVSVAVTRENLDYFQKLAAPDFVLEEVIFVANQQGPNKVAVYGLGRKQTDGAPRQGAPKKP